MARLTDRQIRNMVFKAYLKKVQGKKLTERDKNIIQAWKMAGVGKARKVM